MNASFQQNGFYRITETGEIFTVAELTGKGRQVRRLRDLFCCQGGGKKGIDGHLLLPDIGLLPHFTVRRVAQLNYPLVL